MIRTITQMSKIAHCRHFESDGFNERPSTCHKSDNYYEIEYMLYFIANFIRLFL